jgi:hypothetical protein
VAWIADDQRWARRGEVQMRWPNRSCKRWADASSWEVLDSMMTTCLPPHHHHLVTILKADCDKLNVCTYANPRVPGPHALLLGHPPPCMAAAYVFLTFGEWAKLRGEMTVRWGDSLNLCRCAPVATNGMEQSLPLLFAAISSKSLARVLQARLGCGCRL